jgi:cation transport ATPase
MPTRADFYFVSPGLLPLRLSLRASKELHRVIQRNLAAAIVYNVIAVALCYSGQMSPLLCAVFMPLSSLSILVVTAFSLSPKGALWKC